MGTGTGDGREGGTSTTAKAARTDAGAGAGARCGCLLLLPVLPGIAAQYEEDRGPPGRATAHEVPGTARFVLRAGPAQGASNARQSNVEPSRPHSVAPRFRPRLHQERVR
ncbi:hypothetical protein SUDANB140_05036 [Streptomyces sp. enrichment culture]